MRAQDLVARFGGDEFTFLVEDDKGRAGNALRVADRLVQELQAPFRLESQDVFITASIGIASSTSKEDSPEDLLSNADTAMYQAKATSKATYEVFEPSMSVNALEQLTLVSDLRRALEREEFKLYYQPIIEIASGKIVGMEALVRWERPLARTIASTRIPAPCRREPADHTARTVGDRCSLPPDTPLARTTWFRSASEGEHESFGKRTRASQPCFEHNRKTPRT